MTMLTEITQLQLLRARAIASGMSSKDADYLIKKLSDKMTSNDEDESLLGDSLVEVIDIALPISIILRLEEVANAAINDGQYEAGVLALEAITRILPMKQLNTTLLNALN